MNAVEETDSVGPFFYEGCFMCTCCEHGGLDGVRCKDVNFDCSEKGIEVQCMDSSHVALVSVLLRESAFAEPSSNV